MFRIDEIGVKAAVVKPRSSLISNRAGTDSPYFSRAIIGIIESATFRRGTVYNICAFLIRFPGAHKSGLCHKVPASIIPQDSVDKRRWRVDFHGGRTF